MTLIFPLPSSLFFFSTFRARLPQEQAFAWCLFSFLIWIDIEWDLWEREHSRCVCDHNLSVQSPPLMLRTSQYLLPLLPFLSPISRYISLPFRLPLVLSLHDSVRVRVLYHCGSYICARGRYIIRMPRKITITLGRVSETLGRVSERNESGKFQALR